MTGLHSEGLEMIILDMQLAADPGLLLRTAMLFLKVVVELDVSIKQNPYELEVAQEKEASL